MSGLIRSGTWLLGPRDEKAAITSLQSIKEKIEATKTEIERAEREANLEAAARLRFGTLRDLERQLAEGELRLKEQQKDQRMLKEEVEAEDVAEIVAKRTELKDKPVEVRGQVVKFTPGVMGKNWIHLRDGTGSAADGTNDVTVTTKAEAKVGDVVLVKGVVRIDRDLGSGYAYKVLVEDATLAK